MAQENAIQAENTELWDKLFLSADKGMAMMEDGKNYGEFLLSTIEAAKEQFTGEEYELLKEKARRGWRHERTGGQRHDHAAR